MKRQYFLYLALAGSALLMIGALLFQYVGQMPPCKMCYWQRYPHIAALAIGAMLFVYRAQIFAWLGFAMMVTTAGIGGYHAGVEQGWWKGPQSCTGASVETLTAEELLEKIMTSPVVRCDEIPWSLFGLSMAGWNMAFSAGLAFAWLMFVKGNKAHG